MLSVAAALPRHLAAYCSRHARPPGSRGRPSTPFDTPARPCCSPEGRNVKQVQEWLGHADPGFTLRTYVHLIDEGVGDGEFMDEAVAAPQGVDLGVDLRRVPALPGARAE